MELLNKIKQTLDPDEIVSILGLTSSELVELLCDTIEEREERFGFLLADDEDIDWRER